MPIAPLSTVPVFESTPLEQIPAYAAEVTATFHTGKTRDVEWRKKQLRKLYWAIKDNEQIIVDAMHADIGKPTAESLVQEVYWCENEILYLEKVLDKVLEDKPCDTKLLYKPMKPRVRKSPMGAVLVIAPFNFPFQLAVSPAIGAIAAGNTVVIKPSELTPATSAVIAAIFEKYLDNSAFKVVNGAVAETTALLAEKWDKILYTGNGAVARIVSRAAAEHLTPVVLELGGKNPVFVTENADAKLAGRRVAWGKTMNDGQVCLSPNYAMVHPSKKQDFYQGIINAWKEYYPQGAENSKDISRIINLRHFKRIKALLDNTKGKIITGGYTNEAKLFIQPTIVEVTSEDDSLLSEEIFGPILPVFIESSVPECIEKVKRLGDTPLAVYVFTNDKKEAEYILSSTRSGGATVNDVIMHGGIGTVPFGGVGESGTGAYRGIASVEVFSHHRVIASTPGWLDSLLTIRHPPFTAAKAKKAKKQVGVANFDRDGVIRTSVMKWVFTLGAGRWGSAFWRYLVLAVGVYGLLGKLKARL